MRTNFTLPINQLSLGDPFMGQGSGNLESPLAESIDAADLGAIFRVLDALQPRSPSESDENTYRPSLDDWADSAELQTLMPEADADDFWCEATGDQASVIGEFEQTEPVPVCAVDAGMIRLGETGQETYIALRGNYVLTWQDGRTLPEAILYRSGPLRLPHGGPDQVQALHALGLSLGQADLYVHVDDGNPITVRGGAAGNQSHFPDRVRNAIERQIQLLAVAAITNGILLLDGALSTFDTPPAFLERLVALAHDRGNSIIAVSKRSTLNIKGLPLSYWLEAMPYRTCHRALTQLFHEENAGRRTDRIMGRLFACRFSPLGTTYRVDVSPAPGITDEEALNQFYSSIHLRGGYPDILVQAHALSVVTPPQALVLRAQLAQYGLTPNWDWGFGGAFGPFGGAYKS